MLSLILPTYNESENLPTLIPMITEALKVVPHEIIIVDDDSPDRTWDVAEKMKKRFPHLRVVRRIGKRGLSSAVTDGFAVAHGKVLMVMDSDGQHDAALLRKLHDAVQKSGGVAVGSRYMPGGSVGEWVRDRRILSKMGTHLANAVCRVKVSDPLGGFFAIDQKLYKKIEGQLRPTGFKILLEVLAAVPAATRITEIPLIFQMRLKGHSKLSPKVHLQFIGQILRLGWRRFLPAFLIAAVTAAVIVLLLRAWNLHRLFLSPGLRSAVESRVKTVAAERGWLLSDIDLQSVGWQTFAIEHKPHSRFSVASEHCVISYNPDSPAECTPS